MRRKVFKFGAISGVMGAALVALSVGVVPGASAAQVVGSDTDTTVQSVSDHISASSSRGQRVERLQELSGTQSKAEIGEIVDSGQPAEVLADPNSGSIVSAVYVGSDVSPKALKPVGPGCTTTSYCMKTFSGTHLGWSGTGAKTGTWKSIVYATPGSVAGSVTTTQYKWTLNAKVGINFTSMVTVKRISRGQA